MLGFGFISNSVFVVALAFLSFVVVNAWFIPREEEILAKRHGGHFDSYKKKTRRWF
jgi:protein-S-isoprenylcysteine O-methyltransferase Ste14